MLKYLNIIFLLSITSPSIAQNTANTIKYMPLGDSYTICEGMPPESRWPNLLTTHLQQNGIAIELVGNPARTGYTTQDLIDKELPIFKKEMLHSTANGFTTLLIGVNDWVQKVEKEKFQKNLSHIIEEVLNILPSNNRLILITIPDFSTTPQGAKYGYGRDISKGIAEFNEIISEAATEYNLQLVDIYPTTQEMKGKTELIAEDGLHPSAKEYVLWEKLIYPIAMDALKD